MTRTEFLYEFNLGYNNINNNRVAPGLNEYEISVFLTMALEQIVKNYFNPKGNKYGEGVGDSIKRDHDFSSLITNISLSPTYGAGIDPRSMLFTLPDNVLFPLNEFVFFNLENVKVKSVVPISHEEYQRLMTKPFKSPKKNLAWKLTSGGTNIEIICDSRGILLYSLRYVRKPYPIIVENLNTLSPELSINGETVPYDFSHKHNSELDESLHREIVRRAIEIAKADYKHSDLQSTLIVNQRTE